ncbi:MAG: metal-sensitive transcriptional regulator [Candidatus Omnitrophota bacterium]
MGKYPDHSGNLVSLRRIEGQVRGIQKMIAGGEYCVDILNQIHAVISALARVEDKILEKHFEGCVTKAVSGKSALDKRHKLKEILQLIHQFRKF